MLQPRLQANVFSRCFAIIYLSSCFRALSVACGAHSNTMMSVSSKSISNGSASDPEPSSLNKQTKGDELKDFNSPVFEEDC